MKKLGILIMMLLLVVGGRALAQTRGTMFLGASFPMGDYADFDGFADFALTSIDDDDDDAGAAIGFNAGLKWYFNVGVEGLGVMLSIDGFYNGPQSTLKQNYTDGKAVVDGLVVSGFKYNATPSFINAPFMLGLNYIYHFNPNLGVYVEAGAGGNLRFITDMEYVSKVSSEIKFNNSYDNAFGFAYQAGVGIDVSKNLVIGCSFYDLGKTPVKGARTIKNDPTSPHAETWGTVHPMMLLARVGFSF